MVLTGLLAGRTMAEEDDEVAAHFEGTDVTAPPPPEKIHVRRSVKSVPVASQRKGLHGLLWAHSGAQKFRQFPAHSSSQAQAVHRHKHFA